eukprot:TRINITY_DN6721_c0_g1_i1.p1 TRINITY_DN6721_c0_g1~~TRINITY_DN6721_c0_g1_i1.p1  ORF type:complete len:387 (-),score=-15.84 TRINITY_DN6721_c0_g1_i1:34-1194(-)
MRTTILSTIVMFWAVCAVHSQPNSQTSNPSRRIQVQINKNVELLGFVYFLGYEGRELESNDELLTGRSIRKKDWYGYGLNLYRQYKTYEGSRHLEVAVGFAQDIWLDYFINLLLQLDDFPNAALPDELDEKYYIRFSPTRDTKEAKKNAAIFIDALNQLYNEVNFDEYLKRNQKKYANALAQVQKEMPSERFIPTMENFYGQQFDTYTIMPSLTIPTGMGFGFRYTVANKKKAVHVCGSFGLQSFTDESKLDMGFADKKHLLELSTHEFGHPFVNPALDQAPQELIKETEKLFEPIKSVMANQGYTQWKACLCEHFVRAGEIVIAQNLGNVADAQRLKDQYINERKFIYLPLILDELATYNKKRTNSYQQTVEIALRKLEKTLPSK